MKKLIYAKRKNSRYCLEWRHKILLNKAIMTVNKDYLVGAGLMCIAIAFFKSEHKRQLQP